MEKNHQINEDSGKNSHNLSDLDDLMEENYKNYEVYGDTNKEIMDGGEIINENKENENYKENEDSIVRIPIDLDGDGAIDGYDTNNDGLIDEWNDIGPRNGLSPYYAKPDFDWNDKAKWINNQNAVNFWLKYKKKQEEDLVKTY